jgi:hypothetical protein
MKPRKKQREILDRAFALVGSVPYKVSARWLFYVLLQDGVYSTKKDYDDRFIPLISKARKTFYKGWAPDTLGDGTRAAIVRGDGWSSEESFLRAVGRSKIRLDKWAKQENYVELWFEAKAMKAQFEHYTQHITLRPFGGDCSIPFKWEIATELEDAYEQYDKPIVILYFGDMDPKGFQIPESAIRDIRTWTRTPFEFVRAGLNPGDEITYSIPENPDKPGTYQWEALSDVSARALITEWTSKFISHGDFLEVEAQEQAINANFQKQWEYFIEGGYELT